MSLSCGIVGLPNVGKSTLFNALTAAGAEMGNFPFCTIDPNMAIAEVPDENIGRILSHVETKKVIPAVVKVVDIAGLIAGASKGEGLGNKFLANIRETDAILHVVRCFGGMQVVREEPVDPKGDIEIIDVELALADLDTVQKAVERVAKKARSGDKESMVQQALFERVAQMLESGQSLRAVEWTPVESEALKPLCLLSAKPVLYVANVGDDDLAAEGDYARAVADHAAATGAEWIAICTDLESELRNMDAEDQQSFQEDLGLTELGLPRLIRAAYSLLGLQTFYTVGPKELRAWTIQAGWKGPEAAGVIHTDFNKGFIRAEVYSVDDLDELGSEAAIKAAGRMRTEGRDYALAEGDVCHFLIGR